jgi:chromosome segregation ATPase
MSDIKFDKLVDNLVSQQQQKSELENALQRCAIQEKNIDDELNSLKHQEESIQRQMIITQQEIQTNCADIVTNESELLHIENSTMQLKNALQIAKESAHALKEKSEQQTTTAEALLNNINVKYNNVINAAEKCLQIHTQDIHGVKVVM